MTWTPAVLGARLVLWLDASKETSNPDGAGVARWTDQSSARNDAVQPFLANRPIFTAAGINGLPSIAFDGSITFFQIADAPSLHWGTGDFALMAVARPTFNSNRNVLLYHKAVQTPPSFTGPILHLLNTNLPAGSTRAAIQLEADLYVLSTDIFSDPTPHLFGGRRLTAATPGVLEVRIDGSAQASMSLDRVIDVDAAGWAVYIGHNGYTPAAGFQAFKGEISEMVAIKGTLTEDELASLEQYLIGKYGLREP